MVDFFPLLYTITQYRDNEEKAEDFKITSFISMVKGSECIGIPYSGKFLLLKKESNDYTRIHVFARSFLGFSFKPYVCEVSWVKLC